MSARPGPAGTTPYRRLSLDAVPESAPRAREALRTLLGDVPLSDRLADGELALSELVSNALLHGRPPLEVVLAMRGTGLRIEVHDASAISPTFSMLDQTAVTGRGLLLVSAVSDRWGVDPHAGGKSVWFELDAVQQAQGQDIDVEALLAAWGDDLDVDPAAEDVRVVLGGLDTALVARSEAHVEGLLRELALVAADEQAEPAHFHTAQLVLAAAAGLVAVRAEMRHQISRALTTGQLRVDVRLARKRKDAERVRDLLHALERADRLSRSGELLMAPAPVELSSARDGYLRPLLAQLTW